MAKFTFTLKTSKVYQYALMSTAIILVLTLCRFVNKINYIGSIYVAGAILLAKTEHIKYAISISGTGCLFDLLYVIFHNSDSSWVYVKCFEFLLHFLAFVSEVLWIMFVYCYLKQEETIAETVVTKLNWLENQLEKSAPETGTAETSTTGPKPKAGSDLSPNASLILEQTLISNPPQKIEAEFKNEENRSATDANLISPDIVAHEPLEKTDEQPKTIANSRIIITDLSPKTSMILEQTLMSNTPRKIETELKIEQNGSATDVNILEQKAMAPEPFVKTDEEHKAIEESQLMTDLSPKTSMILVKTLMSTPPRKIEMELKNEENGSTTATNILEPKGVVPELQQTTESFEETDGEPKSIVKDESLTKSTNFERTLRSNPPRKIETELINEDNGSAKASNVLEPRIMAPEPFKETDEDPKIFTKSQSTTELRPE